MSVATDTQRLASSCAEFASVTSQSLVGAMNHGLKEPKKIFFFKGGQYFATVLPSQNLQASKSIAQCCDRKAIMPLHLLRAHGMIAAVDYVLLHASARARSLQTFWD